MSIYGKFDGVTGNVTGQYAGWIAFESSDRPIAGPRASQTSDQLLVLTRQTDPASTALFRLSLSKETFGVTVDFVNSRKPSGTTVIRYRLTEAFISGYSFDRSIPGAGEVITLSCRKMTAVQVAAGCPA